MNNFYGPLFDLLSKGYTKKPENPPQEVKKIVTEPSFDKEEIEISEEIVVPKNEKPKEVISPETDPIPETDDLTKAVIWSEILGPPKCRRRSNYR